MDSVALRRGKRKKAQDKVVAPPPLLDHPGTSTGENAKDNDDPTLEIDLQEARQIIKTLNGEIATLKGRVDMLTEERNFLWDRLKEVLALTTGGAVRPTSGQGKDDTDENSSSSVSSDSEADTDTESSEYKKSKKKFKAKHQTKKEKRKKWKKMRVKTPDQSIRRYNMALKMVKKGGISKSEAYARLGVDRNTIVYQAPIAELAATNPELFKTLKSSFKTKDSIKRFAETCRGFCTQEPTASAIQKKKEEGTLLEIYRA